MSVESSNGSGSGSGSEYGFSAMGSYDEEYGSLSSSGTIKYLSDPEDEMLVRTTTTITTPIVDDNIIQDSSNQDSSKKVSSSSSVKINNNLVNLFAKLNLKLKERALQSKEPPSAEDLKEAVKNMPPPPRPLLVMTNRSAYCYDCNNTVGMDDLKGTGFGYTGINLYFCRNCYYVRFSHGEGSVIDFSEGVDPHLLDQYRSELNYDVNKRADCFNCYTVPTKQLYRFKGLLNGTLIICEECGDYFHKKLNTLKPLMFAQKHTKSLVDEMGYYYLQHG